MSDVFDWEADSDFNDDSFGGGIDVWGMLWRRKWIVVAGTVLGLVLGFLYFFNAQPIYKSSAQVLIERKQPAINFDGNYDAMARHFWLADALKHPIVMHSPEIVRTAYQDHKLDQLSSLQDVESPMGTIMENLQIEAEREGLSVYNISYEGTNRQETGTVVLAIVEAYRSFLESSHQDVGRETRELITEARQELLRQLTAKEEAYNIFRTNAPLMWKDGSGTNLHQERQAAIEAERGRIQLRITELRSELDAIKSAIERGTNLSAIVAMAFRNQPDAERPVAKYDDRVLDRQAVIREQSTLLPLMLQDEDLAARFGKDHPRVKSARRRIEHTQEYLETLSALEQEDPEALDKELQKWQQDMVRIYVESLRHELVQSQQREKDLTELFDDEATKAKELAVFQVQDETHRNDIARTQQLFDGVVERLDEINLTQDDEGYNYRTLAPPGTGFKVAPNPLKVFGIAGVLGGMLGLGLGFLVELTDKSFRSPVEISQRLQLPVVGHVPVMANDESVLTEKTRQLAPVLCTAHQPRSPYAETYRTVRTALYFNSRGAKHQVIQITSPRPGDGKSTLAANLAIVIAQSGKKTLLLDADFRRPTQHRLFGTTTAMGLASVVDGKAEPAEAYRKIDAVDNLTLMACGPRPENPSELLSSAQFRSLLEYLREQFDYVVVDTPPLLAVSDPSAVAAQVDGVLLTMRIDKEARPVALRAREILRELGANVMGIVVNGVGPKESGRYYNYGSKSYGYSAQRYGYGYAYGYGYGDDYVEPTAETGQTGNNGKPETAKKSRQS